MDVAGFLEQRFDDDGEFDELVGGPCSVHFEMLSDKGLWVGISHATDNSRGVSIHIWTENGKLKVRVEDDSEES